MIFDQKNKEIQIKLVYYGPAMSGKTTSIKYLFNYYDKNNELKSIDNTLGRTLFFDFGVLKFEGKEWSLKLLIYSATGQDFYISTRPATLKGVDGIIFVVDSNENNMERNVRSWEELIFFFRDEIYKIPILIAFNKSDLETDKKLKKEDFISILKINRFEDLLFQNTVAITGEGINESFEKIMKAIFPNLNLVA
ncbi:MAG: hypothetical protein GF311_21990 [Candidatus Lokiarchaeota archaeon]|nr:hypothetical protein [Candidatus Lokiarchaeota archaeon]